MDIIGNKTVQLPLRISIHTMVILPHKLQLKDHTIYVTFPMFIIFITQLLKIVQLELQKTHKLALSILMFFCFYFLSSDIRWLPSPQNSAAAYLI